MHSHSREQIARYRELLNSGKKNELPNSSFIFTEDLVDLLLTETHEEVNILLETPDISTPTYDYKNWLSNLLHNKRESIRINILLIEEPDIYFCDILPDNYSERNIKLNICSEESNKILKSTIPNKGNKYQVIIFDRKHFLFEDNLKEYSSLVCLNDIETATVLSDVYKQAFFLGIKLELCPA